MMLCQSLTAEECERAASIVRSRPEKLEILTLSGIGKGSDADADDRLGDTEAASKTILAAVGRFMKDRILPDSAHRKSKRQPGAKAARKHRPRNHKSNHKEP